MHNLDIFYFYNLTVEAGIFREDLKPQNEVFWRLGRLVLSSAVDSRCHVDACGNSHELCCQDRRTFVGFGAKVATVFAS